MKPTKKSYDIDSCSRPNEIMKSPALRKSKYYYINTASFWHHNICGSTYPSMAASKENKLPPSFSGFKSHKFLHESIFGCSKRSPDFKTAVYSMLPSIRMVPVSRHLKQKLNFWGALSVIGIRGISNESWIFQLSDEGFGELKACETVAEEAVLFRSINISWLTFTLFTAQ